MGISYSRNLRVEKRLDNELKSAILVISKAYIFMLEYGYYEAENKGDVDDRGGSGLGRIFNKRG